VRYFSSSNIAPQVTRTKTCEQEYNIC